MLIWNHMNLTFTHEWVHTAGNLTTAGRFTTLSLEELCEDDGMIWHDVGWQNRKTWVKSSVFPRVTKNDCHWWPDHHCWRHINSSIAFANLGWWRFTVFTFTVQKLTFMVSEGKYAIHASYGYCKPYFCHEDWAMMDQFDGISSWCPSLKDGKTKDIADQLTAIRWILARFLFGGWLWEQGTARDPISKGRHIPITEKRAVLS